MWAYPLDVGLSLHLFTKVPRFFEKTNKTTTKYQNLELSDPWRLYKTCCPKRNFDFWQTLNIPIYREFLHPFLPCFGTPWAFLGSRLLQALGWSEKGQEIPCGALPGSQAPRLPGARTPWWGSPREEPRDHPERAPPQDRTGHHHCNHQRPEKVI